MASFNYTPPANLNTQVVVTSATQLAGTLRSDVVYLIDGRIDMGAGSIEVPTGGLTMFGFGYDVAALYSTTASSTLFTSPGGSYSGNLILTGMSIYTTGASSKVFNIDNAGNSGAIELTAVNLGTFGAPGTETTSLGSLTAYRQFRTNDCAIIRILDGLEFIGTWIGGAAIRDTILLNIGASVTVFKAGAGLDFQGSSISDLNAIWVNNTATVFDYTAANFSQDQGFALNGARFNIAAAHDPIPNLPDGSVKRLVTGSSGIHNTYPGGHWELTAAVATTLTVNVPTKLLGTTTYGHLIYWSQTVSNSLVHDSTIPHPYNIVCALLVEGTANDQVQVEVRRWDNSASAYVVERTFQRGVSNLVGADDVAFFNFDATVGPVDLNDRIELWVTNTTGGGSLTLLAGSTATIRER